MSRARDLRTNSTDAERYMWTILRNRQLGAKFRRQQPIGSYIVNFVCFEHKLIIELDGGQHAAQVAQDENRTKCLERDGFRVIRFWNYDILKNSDGVGFEIIRALATPHPRASERARPLPRGERLRKKTN